MTKTIKFRDGKLLKSGRYKSPKPPVPTTLSQTTASRLMYLEKHGLASFADSNFRVVARVYRDASGRLYKMPIGLVHGGV